ncbi:hypothetical protein DFJ73DRAFT_792715 [Zopfochytrium polystomum]|nr:hypothetical protein DFJ73DRAFT_792715 [Zopfochytrium polystomum]
MLPPATSLPPLPQKGHRPNGGRTTTSSETHKKLNVSSGSIKRNRKPQPAGRKKGLVPGDESQVIVIHPREKSGSIHGSEPGNLPWPKPAIREGDGPDDGNAHMFGPTRTTVFTNLATVSSQSCTMAQERLALSEYFGIRVAPSELLFVDYVPGTPLRRTITLKNFSATRQKLFIHPPRTKNFRILLEDPSSLNGISLAPGLAAKIDVEFVPPHPGGSALSMKAIGEGSSSVAKRRESSTSRSAKTEAIGGLLRSLHDSVGFELQQGPVASVALLALPPAARLQFEPIVDFGILVLGTTAAGSTAVNPASGESLHGGGLFAPIARTQFLTVTNTGRGAAFIRVVHDTTKGVLVTPESFVLGCESGDAAEDDKRCTASLSNFSNSCNIQIHFSPSATGDFQHTINLVEDSPTAQHSRSPAAVHSSYARDTFRHQKGAESDQLTLDSQESAAGIISSPIQVAATSPIFGSFVVKANVVPHKLALHPPLRASDGPPVPGTYDFGTIYHSQRSTFSVDLTNRGPKEIRWVIAHAGESSPALVGAGGVVPGIGRRHRPELTVSGDGEDCAKNQQQNEVAQELSGEANSTGLAPVLSDAVGATDGLKESHEALLEDAENKASLTVYPTEGLLQAGETAIVTFSFAPRLQDASLRDKTASESRIKAVGSGVVPQRLYRAPMHLKIIKIGGQKAVDSDDSTNGAGEEPIPINLIGRACPIFADLSETVIKFETVMFQSASEQHISTTDGRCNEKPQRSQNIWLRNNSPHLGFRFSFSEVAQFHTTPSSGTLQPNESIQIKVEFRPNQLGHFTTLVECFVRPLLHSPSSCEGDLQIVTTLRLHLVGAAAQSSVKSSESKADRSNGSDFNAKSINSGLSLWRSDIRKNSAKTHPDWVAKSKNRHSYWDYLRNTRLNKLLKLHEKAFGEDSRWFLVGEVEPRRDEVKRTDLAKRDCEHHSLHPGRVKLDPPLLMEAFANIGRNVDLENGLIPPEPTDFIPANTVAVKKNVDNTSQFLPVPQEAVLSDNRKTRALLQKLLDPIVYRPCSSFKAPLQNDCIQPLIANIGNTVVGTLSSGSNKAGNTNSITAASDVPLTGADLSNIFASSAVIDFGNVTVHSRNTAPLNFLNLAPSKVAISIAMLVQDVALDGDIVVTIPVESSDINSVLSNSSSRCVPTDSAKSKDCLANGAVNRGGTVSLFPASILLEASSIAGFEVFLQSDQPGRIERKVSYLVNGRYRYKVTVKANVTNVQLDLSTCYITITVPVPDILSGQSFALETGRIGTTSSSVPDAEAEQDGLASFEEGVGLTPWHQPQTETTVTLTNTGNYRASFRWRRPYLDLTKGPDLAGRGCLGGYDINNSQQLSQSVAHGEGFFTVDPMFGTVEGNSSLPIRILFTAGIKSVHEEKLVLEVIDDDLAKGQPNAITSTVELLCRGETTGANCSLINSLKQGFIDLGILPIIDSTVKTIIDPTKLNLLMTSTPSAGGPQVLSAGKNQLAGAKGFRSIKIKNSSPNACYFTARGVTISSDVNISPTSGIMPGNGTVTEIMLAICPSAPGVFENAVAITIIGSNKSIKVPFRYEGRRPSVTVKAQDFSTFSAGTIIGSWTSADILIVNDGTVVSRVAFDLRLYEPFSMKIKSIEEAMERAPGTASSRTTSTASPRSKTRQVVQPYYGLKESRILDIEAGNPLFQTDSPSAILSSIRTYSRRMSRAESVVDRHVSEETQAAQVGKAFIVEIQPQEKIKCELIFRPHSSRTYAFQFPVQNFGVLDLDPITGEAMGIPSPIHLSKTSINFKNRVVFKDQGILGVSHFKSLSKETISLTNNSSKAINWSFDLQPLEEIDNVFKIEPSHGHMPVGSSQTISVTFQPEVTGNFQVQAPLHIDYMGMQAPFALLIQGTGVEPSLAFEPPEIFLPTIPLAAETVATFYIINYGCERTEVKYQFSAEALSKHSTLELSFPEGKLLKRDGERLPVIVKLTAAPLAHSSQVPNAIGAQTLRPDRSENGIAGAVSGAPAGKGSVPTDTAEPTVKAPPLASVEKWMPPKTASPISFTIKVEFCDNSHRMFYLPIHATIDASVLSLQTFMWRTASDWRLSVKDVAGPVMYEPVKQPTRSNDGMRRLVNGPLPFLSPTGIPLNNQNIAMAEELLDSMSATIMRWLQDHTGVACASVEFPSQFISSNGRLLQEIVTSLSGRKLLGMAGMSPLLTVTGDDRVRAIFKQYQEMINSLIGGGALLSSVKPEHLMSLDDYRKFLQLQNDTLKSDATSASMHDEFIEYQKRICSAFSIISKESWITVLLQVFRVFVSNLVSYKHFKTLPGVRPDEADLPWGPSSAGNIYSKSDNILLRWVGYHSWKRTGTAKRLTNFTSDFKDSVPFAHLLLSHIPDLQDSHLAGFKWSPSTLEDRRDNASCIVSALSTLFSCQGVRANHEQIADGSSSLEVLLLLLFLYQTLPGFIPKGCIEFHGALHQRVSRQVEFANPTQRALLYVAKLDGENVFELTDGNSLALAPKATGCLSVQFFSRFSRPASGNLKLLTKKMALNATSILVFELKATVDQPVPLKTLKIQAALYCAPPVTIDVDVENPFQHRGKFKVTLQQSRKPAPLLLYHSTKAPTELLPATMPTFTDVYCPSPYRAVISEIEIGPLQNALFRLYFQPFEIGLHECILHFIDPSVGEFMYEIDGQCTSPAVTEFAWTCKAQGSLEKAIRVTPINPLREKALYTSIQSRSKAKLNEAFLSDRDKYQLPKRPLKYKVEYLSPFLKGPSELLLKPPIENVKEKKNLFATEQNYTELPVVFSPKLPGKYSCKIVLNCTELSDIRVYSIHGTAICEGSKAEFEFITPARQTITQEVPIVNKTDEEWVLKASLHGQYFYGTYSLTAKPQSTTMYAITFKPAKTCDVLGQLTISNMQTAQKYVYSLRGIAQEPLPEDQRSVTCIARVTEKEIFRVFNYTDEDAEYDAVTDIPDATFNKRLSIPAHGFVDHEVEISNKKVGASNHIVTYINRADQSYVWFIVYLTVRPPPYEERIVLETPVRSSLITSITISNPLSKEIVINVSLEGDGLSGQRDLLIAPESDENYSFTFAPLLSRRSVGKVVFENDDIGLFWYELELSAIEAAPVVLPSLVAPLGKCTCQLIAVENPLDEFATLYLDVDQPLNFQLFHPPYTSLSGLARKLNGSGLTELRLSPHSRAEIQVVFWPTSVTESTNGRLRIDSPEIGRFEYVLKGEGIMPEMMQEAVVRGQIGKPTTSVLTFTNPLLDPIPVSVSISEDMDVESAEFSLMSFRRPKYNVAGLEGVDIPFTYTPRRMMGRTAILTIEMPRLKWRFPIQGSPDSHIFNLHRVIECRARDRVESHLELSLSDFLATDDERERGLSQIDWRDKIELDMEPAPGHSLAEVEKCLSMAVHESKLEDSGRMLLTISIIFAPNRPFETQGILILHRPATRARWRFSLRFVALPFLVDDTITIEGSIHKVSAVAFHLPNPTAVPRPFKAFFTRDSPPELVVAPTEGVLWPDGANSPDGAVGPGFEATEGDGGASMQSKAARNQFVVGYRASSYAKAVVGTLVIECEDISWSYEVRGVPPLGRPSSSSTAAAGHHGLLLGSPPSLSASSGVGGGAGESPKMYRMVEVNSAKRDGWPPAFSAAGRSSKSGGSSQRHGTRTIAAYSHHARTVTRERGAEPRSESGESSTDRAAAAAAAAAPSAVAAAARAPKKKARNFLRENATRVVAPQPAPPAPTRT